MLLTPVFENFEIGTLLETELSTLITIKSFASTANCPLCSSTATRVQSRYIRTLTDLPASGCGVKIQLRVRRFFCDNSGCLRRIFAERFPNLTRPFAQRTERLDHTLLQIAMVLGGQAGANLAKKLSIPISPDTLLRLIKATKQPYNQSNSNEEPVLKNIGIDDWSWKRGVNFGTIIVNLDTHKVIDLLPDRTSETVSKWLKKHPHLEVISRDRAPEYALAATQGAPQALQIADRFHIVKNLAEQVELLLARLRKEWRPALDLPEPSNLAESEPTAANELPHPTTWKIPPSNQTERKRLARQAEKMDRYHQVIQLRQAGLTQVEIAQRTGISERTIRVWLQAEEFPKSRPRPKRRSIFDPYTVYVLQRWQEGMCDGHQLWLEISAKGFKGKERTLQRFLQQLRDPKRQPLNLPAASPIESLKARKVVWWFIREPAKLDETDSENLRLLRQASPTADQVYQLVQSFMAMVRQLQGNRLEEWMSEIKESNFEELKSFARGIEKDKAAVVAGLTLNISNGVVEGHNHRLKLLKRSMYGRAKLELLKQRVLYSA